MFELLQIKYGSPKNMSLKTKVLAILGDTSPVKDILKLFGYKPDNEQKTWMSPSFSPHHVSTLARLAGIELSDNAKQAIEGAKNSWVPQKQFEDTFKYNMLMDYQRTTFEFEKTSGSCLVGLDVGLGKHRAPWHMLRRLAAMPLFSLNQRL